MRITISTTLLLGSVLGLPVSAQNPNGEALFGRHCAACHVNPTEDDVPTRAEMSTLATNSIVESLTEGTMRLQGQALTPAERIAVAELVTGRPVLAASTPPVQGQCIASGVFAPGNSPVWNGWGLDVRNRRYQAEPGGITAANVANLRLKWAFGVADATQSRSQPAIVGGRLFMGSQSGTIYALDAVTGCTHWTYKAQAGVRTAISVGPVGAAGHAIYFADAQARAYAVDAATGRELWVRKVDDHPAARATGAPTLHAGRLYVVTSGVSEETAASMPDYECCTFRGSLTALDATTGDVVWKTYTVDPPRRRGTSTSGKPLWGPAGSPIWSAPTVDEVRGLIYAATGNAYADPPPRTSDAIVAFDIATGRIRWINQIMPDVWILGCDAPPPGLPGGGEAPVGDNPNCPEEVGPDFDFSASPALVTLANGRDALVVPQKSGVGYLLDPARRGREIWQYRWGRGSPVGGVWGAATDGTNAYFAVADQFTPEPGGLHAVSLATGQRVWYTPPPAPVCAAGQGCTPAQSAALTAIPGVVFSGSADGAVRAYASADGRVLWTFDTNREFASVNGVKANGGSIDGPGPVVAGGMVYVTAGNGGFVGTPGNVLLAFGL